MEERFRRRDRVFDFRERGLFVSAISVRSKQRACKRDQFGRARAGEVEPASLDGVPSVVLEFGSTSLSFFFSLDALVRWPLVFPLSLFRESGPCFRRLQNTRAALCPSLHRGRNGREGSLAARFTIRAIKEPRASTRLTLERRALLGNAIAADDDFDVDKPATSAFAPLLVRTDIGLCIASRCAFAVRFSIRRVEALSHAGRRRREATVEGVARGVNCEREEELRIFFSFFF